MKNDAAWLWDPLESRWERVDFNRVRPGLVLMLHVDSGGYDAMLGWTGNPKDQSEPIPLAQEEQAELDSNDGDTIGQKPQLLTDHLRKVAETAELLRQDLKNTLDQSLPWDAVVMAARWHDVGKAHPAVQTAMYDSDSIKELDPNQEKIWAKSGQIGVPKYRIIETDDDGNPREVKRRGFRHELASTLAWLEQSDGEVDANLIAFLIAAHHGKVRGSIRSMPNENPPRNPNLRFARGLWEGDTIAPVALGDGHTSGKVMVDLSLMELGENAHGRPSWLARVLRLREAYGPFRLAYLEMLVRIADWRGSNEGGTSDV
jgi:CRISPR-associated endonuclease/helicase Cas3